MVFCNTILQKQTKKKPISHQTFCFLFFQIEENQPSILIFSYCSQTHTTASKMVKLMHIYAFGKYGYDMKYPLN